VNEAENPELFHCNPSFVRDVDNLLQQCGSHPLLWKDIKIVLAYFSAKIVYKNGQRPACVQNMKLKEFEDAEEVDDGKYVIKVVDHKTADSCGPANIVLDKSDYDRLKLYLSNIRSKIEPQSVEYSKRLFLTNTGNEHRKINEVLQDVSSIYGENIPNPTIHRKWIDSAAYGNCNPADMEVLNRHMSHSAATSKKWYQIPKSQHALQSANCIEGLSKQYFTKEEDTALLQEYPLTASDTPTLHICQQIIDRHNLKRKKKQLQDRWRVLKKKCPN